MNRYQMMMIMIMMIMMKEHKPKKRRGHVVRISRIITVCPTINSCRNN